MDAVFHLRNAVPVDPRIDAWFDDITDPLRLMVRPWFERMRSCGAEVREVLHDGCPVACVGTAAFRLRKRVQQPCERRLFPRRSPS